MSLRPDRHDLVLAAALSALTVLSRLLLYVLPLGRKPVHYAGYTFLRAPRARR